MPVSVRVSATVGGRSSLEQFAKILSQRMKWANETARQSVLACAVTALKSLRAATKVARASQIKVQVEADASLQPSYTQQGGKRRFCLRYRGSGQRYAGGERVVLAGEAHGAYVNRWGVYRFEDKNSRRGTVYLIAAPSAARAKAKAKSIVAKRQRRYAGLAKRAVGMLMFKANGTKTSDAAGVDVSLKADETTSSRERVTRTSADGGRYSLSLEDALRYALDAIKGGRMAADDALKKAMNKVVSVLNRRLKKADDFFAPHKLETPFPEVRQRK